MSHRLPSVKGREVIAVLHGNGFIEVRRSAGSHVQLAHPDGRRVTVPDHGQTDIGRGLLQRILHDVRITHEEFLQQI